MTVSLRHIIVDLFGSLYVLSALIAAPAAWAGERGPAAPHVALPNVGTASPSIYLPNIQVANGGVHAGEKAPPAAPPVKLPDLNVVVPNIVVNGSNVAVTNSTTVIGGSSALVTGGGTVVFANVVTNNGIEGVAPSVIDNFAVEGDAPETPPAPAAGDRFEMVPQETAIRAICLDDQRRPNPASQVSGDARVPSGYEGEVYRCVAGSALQATLAPIVAGAPLWGQAETLLCAKGQALAIRGGKPVCVAQIPARECNERSLLRKYGPGDKIAVLSRNRPSPAHSEPAPRRAIGRLGALPLDGGVGQSVN